MSSTPSSSILNSTIPAPVTVPSRVDIAVYLEKLQTAREAMEQSDYHTAYATTSELLSNPDLPVALLVACHMIAGTSVLGQRAIDHFHEAQRNAVLYMSGKDFEAFREFTKILIDGAFKEGGEEEDETTKAEIEEREKNKETYAEKLKAKEVVEVKEVKESKETKEGEKKA